MRKIFLTLLLLSSFSCNKHKKQNEASSVINEVLLNDQFVLKINAIIDQDDEFTLYYLEEGISDITKENSVTVIANASTSPQDLFFILKEDILPTKLFLKFGNEQKSQRIFFLTSQMSYGGNSFTIEKEKFYQFFIPNKFIDYDVKNAIAISKELEGKYEPWFGSREVLIDKIFYDFN